LGYIERYREIYLWIYGVLRGRGYNGLKDMTDFQERRQAARFRGALPVEWENGAGITRDFSASGIFFETEQFFSSGESLELALRLEHSYPGNSIRVRCRGEVVRVERNGEKTGVAMAISSYQFEWPGESGRA
jgi:hypothetical protein